MTITTRDQLINAMGNNSTRIIVDKASLSNSAAGQFFSLWRATGQPGQGAIPTAAAVCNNALAGAMNFSQQTAPATSCLTILEGANANSAQTHEIHDRLVAMGGLSGTVTTAQTVGIDLSTLLSTDNLSARIGSDDYSDVLWWLEVYTDMGSTGVNATVAVTYNDASTGNLTAFALGATPRSGRMYPLNGLIPAADSGKSIRAVNSVTLSATTGGAGNFGVTATRYRAANFMPIANARFTSDWAALGLPEIFNSSCLMNVILSSQTTTGTLRATGKVSHG